MPYFTLSYPSTSKTALHSSFIVKESSESLSIKQIQELTLLVHDIVNKHLPCVTVPSSFPLEPSLHTNTYKIIQDVLFPLSELLNEVEISPKTQSSIADLNCSINSCLLKSNSSEFHQPLPSVTEAIISYWKRDGSHLGDVISEKKQRTASTEIETMLEDYLAPAVNITDDDFFSDIELPTPEVSTLVPIIEVMKDSNCFKIINKKTNDPIKELKLLHKSIQNVLDKKIYHTIDNNEALSSTADAIHNTLLTMLSLLNSQDHLLISIVDHEQYFQLTKDHDTLTQHLISVLKESNVSNQPTQSTKTHHKKKESTQKICNSSLKKKNKKYSIYQIFH
ncbi:hypothetical protein CLAVI_000967 [Candidatus Clavichlamydia salmonicola]|uniref:hypothetical protein n=1 Tax=Candidatus Clavichlamydia salmonicola TaxID=469812 RepID=UPI0018915F32|nr:hypothetical protein [Candidatus Clavichlamydia salmonicola]MBF5051326.1 hypothetical protein [Candidatus Clavichlamydia salmonicola]